MSIQITMKGAEDAERLLRETRFQSKLLHKIVLGQQWLILVDRTCRQPRQSRVADPGRGFEPKGFALCMMAAVAFLERGFCWLAQVAVGDQRT